MKKAILGSLIAILLFNSGAFASINLDLSAPKPINAAVRSALLPGWGQMWNQQETKGWIVLGVFAVTVAGGFYFNYLAEKDYQDYVALGAVNGSKFDDYLSKRKVSQIFTFAAIGTWVYAVVDAYFTCKSQVANNQRTSWFNINYNPSNDGVYINYTKKI